VTQKVYIDEPEDLQTWKAIDDIASALSGQSLLAWLKHNEEELKEEVRGGALRPEQLHQAIGRWQAISSLRAIFKSASESARKVADLEQSRRKAQTGGSWS